MQMRHPPLALKAYVAIFYLFLFLPLVIVAIFAFNDSVFPSPPWKGFTLDWFFAATTADGKAGVFRDAAWLDAFGNSLIVALSVSCLAVVIGIANAFVLERSAFPGKTILATMMLWPLVIPGVVLGISILAFFSRLGNLLEGWLETDLDWLRPGLPLVVLGQLSFILSITTMILAARLRKLDRAQEEAAQDLGAGRWRVFFTITLPFLSPAAIGAWLIAVLMSFENFNTTLMLTGSSPPLPVYMYGQMREGASPAINAASLIVMLAAGFLAGLTALSSRPQRQ